MFKARLSKHRDFSKLIDSVVQLLDEVNLIINSEGIFINTIDSSKASMMSLAMPAANFDEYIVE